MRTPTRILFALTLGLAMTALGAAPGKVPAPKTDAEAVKMMSRTFNHEVLPAGANPATLTRLLARGQVVTMEDKPGGGLPFSVAAGTLVDASPATVYAVFTDFAHYKDVAPMTSASADAPAGPLPYMREATYTIELVFSLVTVNYSVYHYNRPEKFRTDWSLASGEFNINVGFMQAIPTDGGRRSMMFYSVYSLPTQASIQKLFKSEPSLELMQNVATATMVSRAIKAEAERREGKKLTPLREKATVEEIFGQDPETVARLAGRGKVLVLENGPTVYVTSGVLVSAPPEKCFKCLSDFASYPQFMPGVKRSVVKGKGKNGPIMEQEKVVALWKLEIGGTVTREYTLAPPDRIGWSIAREAGGPAPGYWRLKATADGKTLMIHGTTEELRNMGLMTRGALKLEPTLEHGLLAAIEIADLDAMKKRIESRKE